MFSNLNNVCGKDPKPVLPIVQVLKMHFALNSRDKATRCCGIEKKDEILPSSRTGHSSVYLRGLCDFEV